MGKPQRSTQDEWLDRFADWSADTQERMLDTCQLLHRQTSRRERSAKQAKSNADAPAVATLLDSQMEEQKQ